MILHSIEFLVHVLFIHISWCVDIYNGGKWVYMIIWYRLQYGMWAVAGHQGVWLRSDAVTGTRVSTFTQADLASRNIQYVHTSEEEIHSDEFTFTVSDGANEVHSQTWQTPAHYFLHQVIWKTKFGGMLCWLIKHNQIKAFKRGNKNITWHLFCWIF